MMGGYLSFPLLCLNSYVAASWAARGDPKARFLVNGDDCIISANHEVPAEAYPVGFRLNDSKTIRAVNVVEVNSTVFLKEGGRWRLVRHLRRGGALSDFAGILHMAKAVRQDVRWTDAFIRSRIGKGWGLLPSQLGLHPRSYPAFCRERDLLARRIWTPLPTPVCPVDDQLVERPGKPCREAAFALRTHLYLTGRVTSEEKSAFNPSRGRVRATFRYRKGCRPWFSRLSYRGMMAGLSVGKGRIREESHQVPAWYETYEERRCGCRLEVRDGQPFLFLSDSRSF